MRPHTYAYFFALGACWTNKIVYARIYSLEAGRFLFSFVGERYHILVTLVSLLLSVLVASRIYLMLLMRLMNL